MRTYCNSAIWYCLIDIHLKISYKKTVFFITDCFFPLLENYKYIPRVYFENPGTFFWWGLVSRTVCIVHKVYSAETSWTSASRKPHHKTMKTCKITGKPKTSQYFSLKSTLWFGSSFTFTLELAFYLYIAKQHRQKRKNSFLVIFLKQQFEAI